MNYNEFHEITNRLIQFMDKAGYVVKEDSTSSISEPFVQFPSFVNKTQDKYRLCKGHPGGAHFFKAERTVGDMDEFQCEGCKTMDQEYTAEAELTH